MILVTGGTGLIGAHLLLELSKHEETLRAIFRSKEKIATVESLFKQQNNSNFDKISWIKADITNISELEEAFNEITHVYHCAGFISFAPSLYRKLRNINIEGTANVVNMCISDQIKKLCYVSSIAVLNAMKYNEMITEENGWCSENNNVYSISKYGAENEVWRASQEGVPVFIVNPGIVLGEGFPESSSSRIFKYITKEYSYYPVGSKGFVDVKDVTKALINGMNSSIKNERFILVGENASFKKILCSIAASRNKKAPSKKLKKWHLAILWRIDMLVSFIFRIERHITKHTAESLSSTTNYSNQKAINELKIAFTPIDEAIKRISRTL